MSNSIYRLGTANMDGNGLRHPGTRPPNDRTPIANQLQGLREQLLEVANRKDTNGVPLLSALGSALAPFLGPLSTSPDYSFEGLPGQTVLQSCSRGWCSG